VKFGPVALAEAEGAILAHALRLESLILKKGDVVTRDRQAKLVEAGVAGVIAARLEPGDIEENEAARRLAERLMGEHLSAERPFTGRVNLFARQGGLVIVDRASIDGVNSVDEAITVATLAPFAAVAAGDMVATVKIIPFAAPAAALDAAVAKIGRKGAVFVAPFRPLRIGVVSTMLPGLKASVVAKTLRVLEARLKPAAAAISGHETVAHETEALVAALNRLAPVSDALIVFGASAITDRRDVIPAAIERFGGRIERFGMPVDPGNLLLLAARGDMPVIGAPGCARSPKENGFDWVINRLLAGVEIGDADIRAMGVGGLLMEIASRPQPRLPDD
jgi:molybdenum cofactor cytidylyltransferase